LLEKKPFSEKSIMINGRKEISKTPNFKSEKIEKRLLASPCTNNSIFSPSNFIKFNSTNKNPPYRFKSNLEQNSKIIIYNYSNR